MTTPVADGHAGCTAEFCRNPLHPGPCKGWKDLLRTVAPGVPDLIRDTRAARAPRAPSPPTPRRPRTPHPATTAAPRPPAAPAAPRPRPPAPMSRAEVEAARARAEVTRLEARLASATPQQAPRVRADLDEARRRASGQGIMFVTGDRLGADRGGTRYTGPVPDEELRAHIDAAVPPDMTPAMAAQVRAELTHQATIAPRTVMHLRGVASMTRWASTNRSAWAYYVSREIHLNPGWETTPGLYGRPQVDRLTRSSFWSPSDADPAASTVAHEFGHHVYTRVTQLGTHEQLVGLADVVDDAIGAGGLVGQHVRRTGDLNAVLGVIVEGRAFRSPSQYGSTNDHEFMAEVWREYTGATHPRPWVRKIGDAMRALAEQIEVVQS